MSAGTTIRVTRLFRSTPVKHCQSQ